MVLDSQQEAAIRALEKSQERLAQSYHGGLLKNNHTIGSRTTTSVEEAAEYLEPLKGIVDEPVLVDLGSGIGSYPLIAGNMGIDSAGIERDPETYRESRNVSGELHSKGLVNAEVELAEGDFFNDAWSEIERELDDFSVVVANHPPSVQKEVEEYLRDEGPSNAVYIFPEVEVAEGFEPLEEDSYFMKSL